MPCLARSTIAMTAYRPLVLSLIAPSSSLAPLGDHRLVLDRPQRHGRGALGLDLVLNLLEPSAERLHLVEEPVQHARHRVGNLVAGRAVRQEVAHGLGGHRPRGTHGLRGDAHHGDARRHFRQHHGVGAHAGVAPDREASEDLRPRADDYAVRQGRVALPVVQRGSTEGHALVERHVVPDLRSLPDHHAHAVVDEEASPDLGARMDLDSGQETPQMRDEPSQEEPFPNPEPVRDPVEQYRVETWIAEHNFQARPRCWILGDDRIDLFTQVFEKHMSHSWYYPPARPMRFAARAYLGIPSN